MSNSIPLPIKFKLDKKLIKVVFNNKYCQDEGIYGEADFTNGIITLCDRKDGKKVIRSIIEQTFHHELTHFILHSFGRNKLKYDEGFVDNFADRLQEFRQTVKY